MSASAYPVAFPRAFASQTIPLPGSLRLTPAPRFAESRRFVTLVPESSFGVALRVSLFAGLLTECIPDQGMKLSGAFTVSILDPADNPRRLVELDDDSDVSSFSYPSATLLDGIPRWVRSYRLSFPLHGLRISRYRGESASPLHLRDRNFTCTKLKLSKTFSVFVPHP